jgi:hypothetical protein
MNATKRTNIQKISFEILRLRTTSALHARMEELVSHLLVRTVE